MSGISVFGPDASRSADFGGPGWCYRYALKRLWGSGQFVNFVMLNPSTADAEVDDPTVRRCVGFAKDWGYAGLVVTNLYALRSTDPSGLWDHPDPVGPDNDRYLTAYARGCALVVGGWGSHGRKGGRGTAVLRLLADAGVMPHYLKVPGGGQPGHPLYLPRGLKPVPMW